MTRALSIVIGSKETLKWNIMKMAPLDDRFEIVLVPMYFAPLVALAIGR